MIHEKLSPPRMSSQIFRGACYALRLLQASESSHSILCIHGSKQILFGCQDFIVERVSSLQIVYVSNVAR